MQLLGDITDANCAANGHGIRVCVDVDILEMAEVQLDSIFQLAQRPSVAMSAASGEERHLVL